MAWRCTICLVFFALTLRILISHIRHEHSTDPCFYISCNVDGCLNTYNKADSFYRHVLRQHSDRFDSKSNESEHAEVDHTDSDTRHIPLEANEHSTTSDTVQNENTTHSADNNRVLQTAGEMTDYLPCEERHVAKDFGSKNMSVNFLMNLKEVCKVKETSAQTIVTGIDTFVQRTVDVLREQVNRTLSRAGIAPDSIPELHQHFDNFILPFDGLQTTYERNKYIKENYLYVAPEETVLGEQLHHVLRKRRRVMDVVNEKYYYIPIHKSIEQLLQNEDIRRMALSRGDQPSNTTFYTDVSDGSIYRRHALFSVHDSALQIMLYFDDIEICNPLGKKAGVHKLGVFYYSLLNLPVQYRSRLPLIRLVAIIKRKHLKRYGMNYVLKRINEDLICLAKGISLMIGEQRLEVKAAMIAFSGDTLAAHEFVGLKEGVGFAYQKCRHCECTFRDMQMCFSEDNFILRSVERYDTQTTEMSLPKHLGCGIACQLHMVSTEEAQQETYLILT